MEKEQVLADFLGVNVEDVRKTGAVLFEAEGKEYFVLTDDEANTYAKVNIRDSLWAFRAEFIARYTKVTLDDRAIAALKNVQEILCEDANELIYALIENFDVFVEDAIRADGRGHFISQHDGEEHEQGKYYIYRVS